MVVSWQVLRLTPDSRLQVVAGHSVRCPAQLLSNTSAPRTAAQSERLGPIVDIGFSARGELYLAEKSVGSEYEVHAVTRAGQLRTVIAGAAAARAECVCDVGNCSLCAAAAPGPLAAAQVTFRALSALTLSPEGHLHLADNRALQILTVRPRAPARDSAGHYEVPDTAAREVFTFDKFGQHLATRSLLTGATRHVFEYSKSLGIGKLLKVTDAIGNKLLLHRDYSQRVQVRDKKVFRTKYFSKTLDIFSYLVYREHVRSEVLDEAEQPGPAGERAGGAEEGGEARVQPAR